MQGEQGTAYQKVRFWLGLYLLWPLLNRGKQVVILHYYVFVCALDMHNYVCHYDLMLTKTRIDNLNQDDC